LMIAALAVEAIFRSRPAGAARRCPGGSRAPAWATGNPGARRAVLVAGLLSGTVFCLLLATGFALFERDEMVAAIPLGLLLASHRRPGSQPLCRLTSCPARRRRRLTRSGTSLVAVALISVVSLGVSARDLASDGGTWSFAATFTRAHPGLGASGIEAGWVWDSFHSGRMGASLPGACYAEVLTTTATPGIDRRHLRFPLAAETIEAAPVEPEPRSCDGRYGLGRAGARAGAPASRPPRMAPGGPAGRARPVPR
ncbi:MAG: hypothetical protein M0T80_12035, partial [Actinomycetota bacterium]|nr:hypothetical protein [Actinomycetota bacterium]